MWDAYVVPMEAEITLLAAARKMDGDALLKIFDLYASALYKYSFRLCNNAVMADQIVGDIFVKLMEQFSTGRGPNTNLRSYLYEMAYHLVVDEKRVIFTGWHRLKRLISQLPINISLL